MTLDKEDVASDKAGGNKPAGVSDTKGNAVGVETKLEGMNMEDKPVDMNKDGSKPPDTADDTNELTLTQQEEKEF